MEVKNVKAFWSWFKSKEPIRYMYLENATTIAAVVGNVVLLAKEIERQNVGNPILFEVYFVGSKNWQQYWWS